MGSNANNSQLAGRARQQQMANEGISRRRQAMSQALSTAPAPMGSPMTEEGGMSGSAAVSEGLNRGTPQGISFGPGRAVRATEGESVGSPAYQQMIARIRQEMG
jgi:hypothetical protein